MGVDNQHDKIRQVSRGSALQSPHMGPSPYADGNIRDKDHGFLSDQFAG